jgi:hypothetical protein
MTKYFASVLAFSSFLLLLKCPEMESLAVALGGKTRMSCMGFSSAVCAATVQSLWLIKKSVT